MISYINQAATNRGWSIEKMIESGDYLTKYTKGDLSFYSDGISTIPVNSQNHSIATNKVLTSVILEKEGIPCIMTREIHLKDPREVGELYDVFSEKGTKKVVLKPIDGNKSKGLTSFETLEELEEFAKTIPKEKRYCISSFFPHLCELRFILFRKKAELYHLKPNNIDNPLRPIIDKQVDISDSKLNELREKAEKIAQHLGFDYIAVDFLIGETEEKVIEVNLNPNLYSFIRSHPDSFQRVVELFERMFDFKEELLKLHV
ncbi:hypothetical protein [Niallia sp. Krafla_26]|uniref:hypothetical protein n=1 Tax=Niallia sp. Krafla_26 TaxID=3064703 RepID=UPI003D175DC9